MATGLPLVKSVLTPLASVLIPLGLSTGISAADTAIQKKIYGLDTTALIISNKKIENIIKIVKSLEESRFTMKGISEANTNETKEQNRSFYF